MSLEELPDELLYSIFEYLRLKELIRVMKVSKRLRSIACVHGLWRELDLALYINFMRQESIANLLCEYPGRAVRKLTLPQYPYSEQELINVVCQLPHLIYLDVSKSDISGTTLLQAIETSPLELHTLILQKNAQFDETAFLEMRRGYSSLRVLDFELTPACDDALLHIGEWAVNLQRLSVASVEGITSNGVTTLLKGSHMASQLTHLNLRGLSAVNLARVIGEHCPRLIELNLETIAFTLETIRIFHQMVAQCTRLANVWVRVWKDVGFEKVASDFPGIRIWGYMAGGYRVFNVGKDPAGVRIEPADDAAGLQALLGMTERLLPRALAVGRVMGF